MRPRTCSRCNTRIDQHGVLTVKLHRTADGAILASPHHLCADCLTREAKAEIEEERRAAALALADQIISRTITRSLFTK